MYTIFKSTRQFKKYMAVFSESKTVVHFGDNRYGQYKDKTKLKLYSRLDHNDLHQSGGYFCRYFFLINFFDRTPC